MGQLVSLSDPLSRSHCCTLAHQMGVAPSTVQNSSSVRKAVNIHNTTNTHEPVLSTYGPFFCLPPPPLHSNRPCIVTGGGGQGSVTFCFSNLRRRLYIALLRCVCWLAKVVLLVHCCALQVFCIQGTPRTLYHAEHISFS